MAFTTIVSAVIATACLLTLAHAHEDSCSDSYMHCEFKFEGDDMLRTFPLTDMTDMPFTNRIVAKNMSEMIGILNTDATIPPEVIMDGDVMDVTQLGSPNFTPTHFKPFIVGDGHGSGIGHQAFTGNQMNVAKGKCMRIFFTSFQYLDVNSNVVANMNDVPKEWNKCVVFMTA